LVASSATAQDRHAALRHELDVMSGHLGVRPTAQQVIADAERLASGYRSLGPLASGFGPADYAVNRELARRSLDWLTRASYLYGRDPLVARAVLLGYDSIGGFYRDYGLFYRPGAFVAYAGATRVAQRLVLYGLDADLYEREAARYALAYGAIAASSGALLTPWNLPGDLPDAAAPPDPAVVIKQVDLPAVDTSKLTPEQKEAYIDARDRFRTVSPRVYQARILLNELSQRLQRQHMTLNAQDAADALKMQSFLEEAADLIRDGQFETAVEALRRTDYMRTKLKGVTGQ
jgi:hypothetical protein